MESDIELALFNCGICNKPIGTKWTKDGLLSDTNYLLWGEVFVHTECLDRELERKEYKFDAREATGSRTRAGGWRKARAVSFAALMR